MPALNRLLIPDRYAARALDTLQPLFALGTRLYVGWVFFKSGWLKISDWEQTIALFEYEYRTPVLSPTAAAILGTFGELAFPIFLWLGLFSRLSALGLFVVNAMAVVSYAHVLLADGFVAALRQHEIWGFMLAMLAIYGAGKFSLDHLLER
jgi:putative oxidoreductase